MIDRYRLHYAPDNASLIVRLVLEELGLSYDTALVDRAQGEQSSPGYRALNPAGLIPVLVTPQGPLFETAAILLWLSDTHGRLAPGPDAPERGAFLKWLLFTSNTLHADMRLLFYPQKYVGADAAACNALRTKVTERLTEHLAHLDSVAAGAPAWLCAAQPSVLGYYIACLMRWMALFPRDFDRSWHMPQRSPHLIRVLSALQDRPATRAAQHAEGLGRTPFTAPVMARPPEGSAT